MFSRRRFLLTLPALAATPRLAAAQSFLAPFRRKPLPPQPVFVYFGTDTAKGVARGIYLSRFDPASGLLTQPVLAAETLRPSFLALSPNSVGRRRLYAVNAVNDASASVTSFLIADSATGALRPINQVPSAGAGPCYISLDATGEAAFVANYYGSSIASYRVLPSGALSEPVERIDYKDPKIRPSRPQSPPARTFPTPTPSTSRPTTASCWSTTSAPTTSPSSPSIRPPPASARPRSSPTTVPAPARATSPFTPTAAGSTPSTSSTPPSTASSGPQPARAPTPQGLLVNTGAPVKTIAPSFPVAKNTAAEVAISLDGNFLYASNRGEDSLVVFAIAPADGALTLVQRISCGGKTPRHFTLDPSERWLLCGNQDSATITIFRRDSASGRIGGPTQTIPLDSPMFCLFA